jgi:hypothetical protein
VEFCSYAGRDAKLWLEQRFPGWCPATLHEDVCGWVLSRRDHWIGGLPEFDQSG